MGAEKPWPTAHVSGLYLHPVERPPHPSSVARLGPAGTGGRLADLVLARTDDSAGSNTDVATGQACSGFSVALTLIVRPSSREQASPAQKDSRPVDGRTRVLRPGGPRGPRRSHRSPKQSRKQIRHTRIGGRLP